MVKLKQIVIGVAIAALIYFVFFNKKSAEKSLKNGNENCEGCNDDSNVKMKDDSAEQPLNTDVDESEYMSYAATGQPSLLKRGFTIGY